MFKRGHIYLAKLYPSKGHEVGKTRPVLLLQTDMLNTINHTTVIVVPLSTQLIGDAYPLRFRLLPRESLEKTSEVLCDQIRAIDVNRLETKSIASLSESELISIEENIQIILGFTI